MLAITLILIFNLHNVESSKRLLKRLEALHVLCSRALSSTQTNFHYCS